TRGGLAQCTTPATSQGYRGNVRRTHRSLSGFSFSPSVWAGPGSSAVSALDRLVRYRPRFLLHGVVGAVGVAAIASIAVQPRPVAVSAPEVAPTVAVATPMMALDIAPEPPPSDTPAEA